MIYKRYTPARIAYDCFQSNAISNSVLPTDPYTKIILAKGREAFQNHDFEEAAQLFSHIDDADPIVTAYAKWYSLLAQLAQTGPTKEWTSAMESFILSAPDVLKVESEKLLRLMSSSAYRSWYRKLIHHSMGTIKPNII